MNNNLKKTNLSIDPGATGRYITKVSPLSESGPGQCLLACPSVLVMSNGSPTAADCFNARKQTANVCTGKGILTKSCQGPKSAKILETSDLHLLDA